jgi:guanidinopropionase
VILRSLQGRNLVGADICEVAPCYDPTGMTSVVAANLMFELLCVLADARASRTNKS